MELSESFGDYARCLSRRVLRVHLRFAVVNADNDNAGWA